MAASAAKPEFPPLLAQGLHSFDRAGLKALTVDGFPNSNSRPRLWDNFQRLVLDALATAQIACEVWVDGSFLTQKIDPDDVDFVVDVPIVLFSTISPAQQQLLDQYVAMAFRASDDLHSFVMFNTPAGHPMEPAAIQFHQQWERDFGTSYIGRVAKGIAVVGVP